MKNIYIKYKIEYITEDWSSGRESTFVELEEGSVPGGPNFSACFVVIMS